MTLPDGSTMTRADLPPAHTRRWVASRKGAIVAAVGYGLVTREYALQTYSLSEDEFAEWELALRQHGQDGLKTTALQRYRQLKGE